ncbi:5956_t:CDS:1 [Gigaspora margarita]|uniref:5956_t:CDS:1 n=1 Tax=Gigaspora margarita TaxID=4874 RepID=A0ABM8W144_GIGMA|nr:5956_t:CDS:1 [Gigaspora margarita]
MPKAISSQKTLARHFNLQGIDSTNLQPIAMHNSSLPQNVEPQKQKLASPPPTLILPFPPPINPEDLMKTSKLPSKPPNAFFIYRKVYTRELVAQNLRFKMTDVSPWVSISWKRETPEVKDKYKAIAKEVRQLYKQLKLNSSQQVEDTSSSVCDSTPSSGSSSPPLSDNQFLSSLFWMLPTNSNFIQLSDSHLSDSHLSDSHLSDSQLSDSYLSDSHLSDSFEFPTSPDNFSLWHDDNIFQANMYESGNIDLSYEFIDLDYSQYLNEHLDVEQTLIQSEGLGCITPFE